MLVNIADLFPYELSAITGKVSMQKKLLEKDEARPIKILKLDGQWLVTDGANRVVAAKELGRKTIEAVEVYRQSHEIRPYREALAKAVAAGLRGFENFPQSEAPVAVKPKIPAPVNLNALYAKRPISPPPSAVRRPAPAPSFEPGLGLTAVMKIVKGCTTRERVRISGIIGSKDWIVTKADHTADLDASIAKLSAQIADSSHDEQVFAWKEPGP